MDHLVRDRTVTVDLASPPARFFQHGWQSWSDTRWVDAGRAPMRNPVAERWPMVDDPVHTRDTTHGGSGVGAAGDPDEEVVLVGALGAGGRVALDGTRLVGTFEPAADGEWLVARGTGVEVFERYAALLGERLGRRSARHPRIWCSWYSFYGNISEARLVGVLDDLAGLPFDVFQVDDGWQRAVGDWHANADFPSGMAALASRIRDAGLEPGLWLAPFLVRADSSVATERPEMLLRDDAGAPVFAGHNWGGPTYALDVTHPATEQWITELIERAVGDGYTYLKLDFLYAAALPGRHIDAAGGREAAYRRAVERVRAAAGDDTYLLACGAPVVPSIGVFDALRVGPDVAPWWEMPLVTQYLHDPTAPATRFAIATSANRLWLASAIEPDPDVVYFRRRYNLLSGRERQLLRDLAVVCGFRATSDPPGWLDARERDELESFFLANETVVPIERLVYEIGHRRVDLRSVADADQGFRPWG